MVLRRSLCLNTDIFRTDSLLEVHEEKKKRTSVVTFSLQREEKKNPKSARDALAVFVVMGDKQRNNRILSVVKRTEWAIVGARQPLHTISESTEKKNGCFSVCLPVCLFV